MARVIKGPWAGAGPQRAPLSALWAALWPDLAVAPSVAQERVIAEVMAEIGGLLARSGAPLRDPAAWLRAVADAWPPASSKDYSRLLARLKAKKAQLQQAGRRDEAMITTGQLRKLWAALRAHPHLDEDWLRGYIKANFKRARRDGKPSVSQLTRAEAARIIDILEGRAPQRRRA